MPFVLNVELFKKWGRKDDIFSKFFGEGKNPYSKEATEQFYGHADHCRKKFGVYSKEMIQNTVTTEGCLKAIRVTCTRLYKIKIRIMESVHQFLKKKNFRKIFIILGKHL